MKIVYNMHQRTPLGYFHRNPARDAAALATLQPRGGAMLRPSVLDFLYRRLFVIF